VQFQLNHPEKTQNTGGVGIELEIFDQCVAIPCQQTKSQIPLR